jgi:hypothetical protein
MSDVVSWLESWLLHTTDVRFQVCRFGICGGPSDIAASSSPNTSDFACQCSVLIFHLSLADTIIVAIDSLVK